MTLFPQIYHWNLILSILETLQLSTETHRTKPTKIDGRSQVLQVQKLRCFHFRSRCGRVELYLFY